MPTKRIAITGASGFVGRALASHLTAAGHEVLALVRGEAQSAGQVAWNPGTGALDREALGAVDAVVHLAGENVAGGRWSAARKQRIAASRGPATEALCRALAALPHRPAVFVGASATGIYGDRGELVLDERSPRGSGFLADVAAAWEAGTEPARAAGMRVVNLRIGVVLDGSGGALRKMLLPFRLGLGGRLGHGRQWMSWITRHDLVRAVSWVLAHQALPGPVLAVAPNPVRNREFTQALARALHRPAVLPVPAFALRVLFGEMADALLSSQRAIPGALTSSGFLFEHPEIGPALRTLLG
ncbi:MAG TPA: TIGR01777 family oxidoreductase [Planctomycetota bacterium]|nr:TIGR01777 family oxidoreductase [Planctomycetota bacterium]